MPKSGLVRAFSPGRIAEILSHPRDHPTELSLLVGMAILTVFALSVIFALLFVKTSSKRQKRSGGHLKRAGRKQLLWLLVTIGWFIVLLLSVSYAFVADPAFCLSCHGASRLAKDLRSSAHKRLACQDCHETPGFVGSIAYRLEVGRMVVAKLIGRESGAAGSASRDACLSCHEKEISKTVVAKSIRIEHKVPIAKGYRCERCHFGIAHNEPKREMRMSICYDCHGKDEPLRCEVCHVDIAGNTAYSLKNYAKVALSSTVVCEKCHDPERECVRCHRIAMPHSAEFKRWGHALRAVTDRRECLECHKLAECARCHPKTPGPHGNPDWFKEHGSASRMPQAGCFSCHRVYDCLSCHVDLNSYGIRAMPSR